MQRLLGRMMLVGLVACAAPGCATVAHGPAQKVVITTDPIGADVFLNDKFAGNGPVAVRMWRGRPPLVTVEKPGYVRRVVKVRRSPSGWIAADIGISLNPFIGQGLTNPPPWPVTAIGPLVSLLGIDLLTGAAFRLPEHVNVTLCSVDDAEAGKCAAAPASEQKGGRRKIGIR